MSPGGPGPAGGARKSAAGKREVNTERLAKMGSRNTGSRGAAGQAATAARQAPRRRTVAAAKAAAKAAGKAATRTAVKKGAAYAADVFGTPATGAAVRGATRVIERVGVKRMAVGVVAVPLIMCCLAGAGVVAVFTMLTAGQHESLAGCPVAARGDEEAIGDLDDEQYANGELIVRVGVDLQLPPRALVIAVATAMQESSLRNLPHLGGDNDHDSLGLFQQRPSQGWGSAERILDPVSAATAFYERLVEVEGWQEMSLTRAAQAVQRSAYPDAYARHEPLAVSLVTGATGATAAAGSAAGMRCAQWHETTTAGWTRPAAGPMWSGFRTANRPEHYGIDIGAPRGTEIRAAADGRVILVECHAFLDGEPYSCDVDGSPAVSGCGWYVDIRHAGNVVTRYCHLAQRPDVEIGQEVAAGQPIGLVGSSGRSSGPHLHFEVELRTTRPHGTGVTVERRQTDPVAFLAARGVVVECTGTGADCEPVHGDRVRLM